MTRMSAIDGSLCHLFSARFLAAGRTLGNEVEGGL